MIEYLYNAIRATAGSPITITAEITDDSNLPIVEGCALWLYGDTETLAQVEGIYNTETVLWEFTLQPEITEDLCGRFWYCIKHNENVLSFKEPIYLM